MKKNNKSSTVFSVKLEQLKLDFEKSVQLFEQKKYVQSHAEVREVYQKLVHLRLEIKHDYPSSLDKRFEWTNEILREFKNKEPNESTLSTYTQDLIQLDSFLRKMELEIKKNYPTDPVLLPMIKKHKKQIFMVSGLLAIVFCVWGFIGHYLNQHRGLLGEYCRDQNFTKVERRRIDPGINFIWGSGSPFPKWRKDKFCVRWTGYLRVPKDGEYQFFTNSDDGVSLWIGRQSVLSNWTTHSRTMDKGGIQLKSGYYPIEVQYFDEKRQAVIQLFWQRPDGSSQEIIKSAYLVPKKEYLSQNIPVILE